MHILPLIDLLKRKSKMGKIFDVLSYSLSTVGPFFMVVFFVYILFAEVGMSLFGGCINELSADLYLKHTGGSLNE